MRPWPRGHRVSGIASRRAKAMGRRVRAVLQWRRLDALQRVSGPSIGLPSRAHARPPSKRDISSSTLRLSRRSLHALERAARSDDAAKTEVRRRARAHTQHACTTPLAAVKCGGGVRGLSQRSRRPAVAHSVEPRCDRSSAAPSCSRRVRQAGSRTRACAREGACVGGRLPQRTRIMLREIQRIARSAARMRRMRRRPMRRRLGVSTARGSLWTCDH